MLSAPNSPDSCLTVVFTGLGGLFFGMALCFLIFLRDPSEQQSPTLVVQSPAPTIAPTNGGSLLYAIHRYLDLIGAEGAAMWHTGRIQEQTDLLFSTARQYTPKFGGTLCEVGFNVGHSASTLIIATGATSYVGFDYGEKSSVAKAAKYIRDVLGLEGVSLELSTGNSQYSVPSYFEAHSDTVCDVVHIDGSHDGHFPLTDFQNLRAMARSDGKTLVLFDDCGCPTEWCVAPQVTFTQLLATGAITLSSSEEKNGDAASFFSAGDGATRTCFGLMAPHRKTYVPYPHAQPDGEWERDYD